jgi:hypothetical protein
MLDQILALNERAAAAGDYEVAYHLLMAALHAADHAKDRAALDRILALSRRQGAAVDAEQPPHQLSRAQAHARGQTALFESLAAHIEAVRLRMHSEEMRTKR